MYTDPYEFKRSQQSQALTDHYNTYSRKDYNYLPDTNQSVYTNTSLSLVTFDLSSIYNSSRFTDTNDLVVVIPITLAAACAQNNGTQVAITPTMGLSNLVSLKSNYVNLVHQCDVQINGKTCNDLQPYTNILKNFEMLSEMSPSDLQIFGSTYGLGEVLDNPRSVTFTKAALNSRPGTGFCNNIPFGLYSAAAPVPAGTYPSTFGATQNTNTCNTAVSSRLNTFVDTMQAVTVGQNIYGVTSGAGGTGGIMGLVQLQNEFKPHFQIVNGCAMWFDYAIIRLGSLLESLRAIGLTRRFDAVLRLYINTGTIAVPVLNANTPATVAYGGALQGNSTFSNTCPFTINHLPFAASVPAQ